MAVLKAGSVHSNCMFRSFEFCNLDGCGIVVQFSVSQYSVDQFVVVIYLESQGCHFIVLSSLLLFFNLGLLLFGLVYSFANGPFS